MTAAAGLRGRDLVKEFPGPVRALDGVSFEARPGRVLTLLGPSGCGKTTLLRIIAGLESATSGSLELEGRDLLPVPPGKRDVGMVFQNYALYPHLTVAGNLALALEVRRVPRPDRERRVREVAELLEIAPLLARRPGELSGGQQQRVALGRALVRRPRIFLLDEPLSNLDAQLRESTRSELRKLFRRVEGAVVYVTHDQAEAMSLSDEIAVMRSGRIAQCAGPDEVYGRPADLFVATFVGSPRMNVWRAEPDGSGYRSGGIGFALPPGSRPGGPRLAGLRPEDVEVSAHEVPGAVRAGVELVEPLGARALLTLRVGDSVLRALAAPGSTVETVWARWDPERVHWFDPATERRLDPDRA
jgi:ABC-type sugar transport system ATPase subunit